MTYDTDDDDYVDFHPCDDDHDDGDDADDVRPLPLPRPPTLRALFPFARRAAALAQPLVQQQQSVGFDDDFDKSPVDGQSTCLTNY